MAKSPTETQELLKFIQNKFGYTLLEISQKIGMTEAMISRWNNAKSKPTKKNFQKLKQLASEQPTSSVQVSPTQSSLAQLLGEEILKTLTDIPGRFTQLGEQIAMLQGDTRSIMNRDLKEVRDKIARLEKIEETLKKTVEDRREQAS